MTLNSEAEKRTDKIKLEEEVRTDESLKVWTEVANNGDSGMIWDGELLQTDDLGGDNNFIVVPKSYRMKIMKTFWSTNDGQDGEEMFYMARNW